MKVQVTMLTPITELGGTIGDIEGLTEAMRQIALEVGRDDVLFYTAPCCPT